MRLAFAIATSFPADNLVMDEWLSAGDSAFRASAEERMVALVENSGSLVIASHNPGILRRVCTRTLVLHSGNIIFDGTTDDAIEFYQREIVLGGRAKREQVGNISTTAPSPKPADPEGLLTQRIEDMENITNALMKYREKHGHFPKSGEAPDVWLGIGRNRLPSEEWIPGLVPKFLDIVPRDPLVLPSFSDAQYIYQSNGTDYKLLVMNSNDSDQLKERGLEAAIDPKRAWAYGTWTEGYKDV